MPFAAVGAALGISASAAATGAVGLIGAGASLIGSMNSSDAASSAADTQAQSATQAEQQQAAQFAQTRADLLPYNTGGQSALTTLGTQMPTLTAPFNPTEASLAATPGYQFTLDQGIKSTQAAAAARGLGVSGAALKGASDYTTGLADRTWQNVANNYYTGQNNAFNKLYGVSSLGEDAAAKTGSLGQQAAANQTGLITGAGNALAAGQVGSANALSGGLTGAANSALNSYYANQLLGSNSNYLNGGGGGVSITGGGLTGGTMPLTAGTLPYSAFQQQ